ncbi:MAG: TIGR00180 family glycosyltransferase [Gammaproteobacteria bacterium]|nr:TIGR00180 family glycosyltransferase [Gammaproteobacteria bacterium]
MIIRDRPFYTLRWMNYANQTSFPFKILIADGGKDLSVETNLQNTANYPNLNYDYLRYPYDENIKQFLSKISDALDQVKTTYVILADDDDFWSVDGLREAIRFLEENSDYASCRGRNFAFTQNKSQGLNIFFHRIKPADINIDHPSTSQRVMKISSLPGTMWYNVHRTINHQAIFQKLSKIDLYSLVLLESVATLMDAAAGKMKQLDVAFILREDGHGDSTSSASGQNHFSNIILSPYPLNLHAIFRGVSEEVAKSELIDIEQFTLELQKAYLKRFVPRLIKDLYIHYPISFSVVLANLKMWILEKKYPTIGKYWWYFKQWCLNKTTRILKNYSLVTYSREKLDLQNILTFLKNYKDKEGIQK